MPKYSNNSLTGLTLNDVGYYWAPSDYFDMRLVADITENEGIILRSRNRYVLRYRLRGAIEASYNYNRETGQRRSEVRFNHTQEVDPTLRIVAQGNFSSSRFNQTLSQNLTRRLERVLRSHMNVSKRFESGANISATLSRTTFLDQGTTDSQLPSLQFRLPRRPLFGGATQDRDSGLGGLGGFGLPSSSTSEPEMPDWRDNLYIDYNFALISKSHKVEDDPRATPLPDTLRVEYGFEQRTNLTYSGKVMGWLNLQPSVNAREAWYFGDTAEEGFQRRLLWSSSIRASTKLYGIVDNPLGINAAFRHVVEPSLSINYQPDFTNLPAVPGLFGSNPGPQRSLRFGLGQIFQMKRVVNDQERKTDLARINTTGSYNAESRTPRKLSDVNSSLVMNPSRALSLQMNTQHRFYSESDEFQWTPVLRTISYRSSLRLDSATVSSWLGIGRAPSEAPEDAEEDPGDPAAVAPGESDQPFASPSAQEGDFFEREGAPSEGTGRLWNLTLGHDYGWTRGLPGQEPNVRHSLDGSLTFNLPKWNVTWTARYDFEAKEMVRQSFSIYRDLHCFEARLQLVPTGPGRGYWFVIGIKDIPEIKYERRQTIFR
jgi:hypothetical protein